MRCQVTVYKTGDSVEVQGIKCDFARIELHELDLYLQNGWVKTPEETLKAKVRKSKS